MAEFRSIQALTTDPRQQPDKALEEIRRALDETIKAVNLLGQGKIGSIIDVTLTANAASTTVTNPFIWGLSRFLWSPRTANAVAELVANGPPLVTTTLLRSATFSHVNNAQADRTFGLVILG